MHQALLQAFEIRDNLVRHGWHNQNATDAVCIEVSLEGMAALRSDPSFINDFIHWHQTGCTGPVILHGFRTYEVRQLPDGKEFRIIHPPIDPRKIPLSIKRTNELLNQQFEAQAGAVEDSHGSPDPGNNRLLCV